MDEELFCYRCGESLAALTPPISRQDECPSCFNYLHVCRMCVNFDLNATRQCIEDGAEDVTDKEKVNFCDWYKPSTRAFAPERKSAAEKAENALASLFGENPAETPTETPAKDSDFSAADDLFK